MKFGKRLQSKGVLLLTSSAASHEPEVVEFCDLVLDDGGGVPHLAAVVLVVAGPHGDRGSVQHLAEHHHLEGDGQRLVGAPVSGEHGAEDVGRGGAHQLPGCSPSTSHRPRSTNSVMAASRLASVASHTSQPIEACCAQGLPRGGGFLAGGGKEALAVAKRVLFWVLLERRGRVLRKSLRVLRIFLSYEMIGI
ncbi:hypothetical protein CEXT_180181 [Caerostris extrusa]|uniref:Uncharacterized protein n=1 Tax=Caerostris extrusa TaxID=172846 RepID=A0AAV4Q4N0_CAEEX|nr:hypothetical protein CEXT_180181 [Caerostris extrusa]